MIWNLKTFFHRNREQLIELIAKKIRKWLKFVHMLKYGNLKSLGTTPDMTGW
jgi:hypothetical protein